MSGSVVPFTYIPPSLRVPLFYAEFDNTNAGVNEPTANALIIGQSLNAVTSTLTYIPSVAAAVQMYGAGSQLAAEIAAYMTNDPVTPLWAVPYVDAGGSVAAAGAIVITGTATAAGTLFLYIAGQLVQVGVSLGDTNTVIATNIYTAINAFTYAAPGAIAAGLKLPVVATNGTAGTATITAQNKGTLGNSIPLMLNFGGTLGNQSTPAGITVAITAMSGGSGDPVLTGLSGILGLMPFDFICNPYGNTTGLAATTALMADQAGRWSYSVASFGHVFSAAQNSVANLITLGAALNDQHLTVLGVNSASPTPSYVWAAAYMGAVAPSLQATPNRPLQTLPIAGVLTWTPGNAFTFSNKQALLSAGIALPEGHQDGSAGVLRAITTYQTNKWGQSDQSYLDTETLYSIMAFTRTLKNVITQKFPRALLADDGTKYGFGVPIVTPSVVRNELIAQYAVMTTNGLVENTAAFKAGLIVARDTNDPNRLDVLVDPNFVGGLRIFATLVQFSLNAA